MPQDAILTEIRRIREAYAAKFNYDIEAICHDAREQQKLSGRKVVSRPPRPVVQTVKKGEQPAA